MNNRYYANIQGTVAEAIVACLKEANEICAKDAEVKSIVLYSYTKSNFNTVAQIFGAENVNKMFTQPLRFEGIAKPVQCLTEHTYKDWSQQPSIVICCHMDSKAVQKIDDYHSAKYILAVSWLKDELEGWAKRWDAECIYGDEIKYKNATDGNLALLRIALEEMDIRMFGSKDFHHLDDENTCKCGDFFSDRGHFDNRIELDKRQCCTGRGIVRSFEEWSHIPGRSKHRISPVFQGMERKIEEYLTGAALLT